MDLYERNTCSFVVKVWIEPADGLLAPPQWRGHITHVFTGQRQYFDKLEAVTRFIATYLAEMGVRIDKADPRTGN